MMLLLPVNLSNIWCARAQHPIFPALFRVLSTSTRAYSSISSSPKLPLHIDEDCTDFLPWLRQKSRTEISTSLFIGKSPHGRGLFAAEDIFAGDCLLEVPFSVQLAPDNLPPGINSLLGDEVGHVAKVALLMLHEQKLGQNSQWAPYIGCLPQLVDLHSTIFWSSDELKMIQPSFLYNETLRQKTQIEKDFLAVKLAFDQLPNSFQDVTLQDFTYAYGLVSSRGWESSRGVSMVMISYGRFSNATLLLDFGFTVPYNIYDQVQVELNIPQNDDVYTQKLELLNRYRTPSVKDLNMFTSSWNSFIIKIRCLGYGSCKR